MSIQVGRFWVVYESFTMNAIDPEYLSITEEEIREYMKEHPMPDDENYSEEDLIGDITNSSGFYCLPDEIKEETREYVKQLLNDLIK